VNASQGNLGGQFVKGQGRHQADHGLGDVEGDGDQVRVGERGKLGQAVETPAEPFQHAGIAHGVEGARVDAQTQRLGGAQGAAVLSKQGNRFLLGFACCHLHGIG